MAPLIRNMSFLLWFSTATPEVTTPCTATEVFLLTGLISISNGKGDGRLYFVNSNDSSGKEDHLGPLFLEE